jgi:hypothetical protein
MPKSKTITAALAALTIAATIAATNGQAQAHSHHHFGGGIGLALAAGALIGAAAVSSNSYYYARGYDECRFVNRVDRWGNVRTIKICDVAPY